MSSGHPYKTRAEQDRISSFLHDNTRRSNSQEKKSRRNQSGTSSRQRRHRHPLDPVESDSDSDHRSRNRSNKNSKSKHRRSYSRSSSSENERRRKRKQHETNNRRHQRRHSSASSSHSSTTRSKSRDRKRRISVEKHEPKLTSTIVMHNIPLAFDEHELLTELSIAKVPVQETRIIHRRDPATNLQTAYVEFNTIQEAEQWMNLTQGTFLLNDHPVTLTHRYDDDSSSTNINSNITTHRDYQRNNTNELRLRDWDCYKCGVQNFKRRDHCFNCHISREDSERTRDLDGYLFVGLNPCNTLVLRGLDILTSKETIEAKLIELTLVQMKNTAIVKDNYTGVSRGFAFVEYNSIHESVLVYESLQTTTPGVEIEGKAVIAHFSKNNFATSLAQIQDEDEDFYSRRSSSSRHRHRHDHDHDRAPNVAQLLPSNNVDRTNTAAEIAQQALQNIHAQKQRDYTRSQRRRNHSSSDYSSDSSSNQQSKRHRSTKTSNKEPEQYSTPDPSKFEWYPDVGYHFDKTTGFYFDAKSTYFYNPTTQKYMYWDPLQSNYIPVEDTTTTAAAATGSNEATNATTIEANEKAEKFKNAQKVAKEMEQWAKKEREKKEKEVKRKAQAAAATASTAISTADTASSSATASGTSSFADIGLPSARPTGGLISLSLMSSGSSTSTVNRPALLAAFDNPDSDNDDTDNTTKQTTTTTSSATTSTNILDASEEKLVDWNKLTCNLCQRQFDTRDILEKHLQQSNLHKENLAKAGIVRSQPLFYRDRAKERREKFGTDETSKRNEYSPVHERSYPTTTSSSSSSRRMPTQNAPLSSDSIGSKLMKKHGWQEGQGLGKKLQGRADPVEAEMRQRGAGLGADSRVRYQAEPGESYKDVVRKVARARFSMMES
ncbi:unnamed protein product [Adineta steineri]|uniref:Uncharacterized protein n=1 Tax=Adineta steineri TaxID=433720 RepID=A0A818LC47_9BILA|nr:unnamed protein product [Adineta steineri]